MKKQTADKTILKATIKAQHQGRELDRAYRAALTTYKGRPTIVLEEQTDDGEWNETPGWWNLASLLEAGRPSDAIIAIDFGQRWMATGAYRAAQEAADILGIARARFLTTATDKKSGAILSKTYLASQEGARNQESKLNTLFGDRVIICTTDLEAGGKKK